MVSPLPLATLWRNEAARTRHFDGTRRGLARLDRESRQAEFGHALAFLCLTGASVVFALRGTLLLALFTQGFNILGNLYPVLLQRHHRMRLQRIRSRAADPGGAR